MPSQPNILCASMFSLACVAMMPSDLPQAIEAYGQTLIGPIFKSSINGQCSNQSEKNSPATNQSGCLRISSKADGPLQAVMSE
ncbi:MAG: hypothetical protein BWY76_02896 [bacterium ADurb.Bin429]|nr:MAG: hypothetical protein BWY76_02896 [bacterium ADurb.Bin429]